MYLLNGQGRVMEIPDITPELIDYMCTVPSYLYKGTKFRPTFVLKCLEERPWGFFRLVGWTQMTGHKAFLVGYHKGSSKTTHWFNMSNATPDKLRQLHGYSIMYYKHRKGDPKNRTRLLTKGVLKNRVDPYSIRNKMVNQGVEFPYLLLPMKQGFVDDLDLLNACNSTINLDEKVIK